MTLMEAVEFWHQLFHLGIKATVSRSPSPYSIHIQGTFNPGGFPTTHLLTGKRDAETFIASAKSRQAVAS